MAYKVTYILGAGASQQALPIIKRIEGKIGLADSLRALASSFESDSKYANITFPFIGRIVDDLKWLADNSDKFGTVDTFAKFLSNKNMLNDLNKLKIILSIFFTIKQIYEKEFDKRSLIFLTSVLDKKFIFPNNIKILNWNYDFQIQLAADEFRKEEFSISQNDKSITTHHSPPIVNYYPRLGYSVDYDINELNMIHLNGIAGFYFHREKSLIRHLFIQQHIVDLDELFHTIHNSIDVDPQLLTFAWEKDTISSFYLSERIKLAEDIVDGTQIIVVIGYSFPFFNREVDMRIFNAFKKSGTLEKIYLQDPIRNGNFLRDQFDLDPHIEIKSINEVENYFIPLEL